jgi:hypothetical protein
MNGDGTVTADCWVQIEPRWSTWYPGSLRAVRVTRVTFRKPRAPAPGCILVRLRIAVPLTAFVPAELDAGTAQVAPGGYERVPARVEAAPL